MTVVIAQVKDGRRVMASDSLDHDNHLKYQAPKIINISNRILIGISGMAKMYDIASRLTLKANKKITQEYLAGLGQTLFEQLKEELLVTKPDEIEAEMLFLTDIGIFSMSIDSPIYKHEGFWAIGSGQKLALGYMEAGGNIEGAVACACKYDPNCGEPVTIEELK